MSMNLHISATRPAVVTVRGVQKTITDRLTFDLWQTPTKISYEVMALSTIGEQVAEYGEWCRSISQPYEEDILDYDRWDENMDPIVIGKQWVDPAADHMKELHRWLQHCHDEDYTVVMEVF